MKNARNRAVAGGKKFPTPSRNISRIPSALRNPDDERIYRLLVESGWLAEEQLEFKGSCLKETPLCRWWHREVAAKKRRQGRA
jgi:hypothetical protein